MKKICFFIKILAQKIDFIYNGIGDSMNYLINLIKHESGPHKHKNYEIIIYTKGRGIFHSDKKEIKTSSGKIIIIPPDTVHHSSNIDESSERIYISGDFSHVFELTSPAVIADNAGGEGVELAKMIYKNRFSHSEYISALINAFMHFLLIRIKMENEIFMAIKNIIDEITDNFYLYDINLSSVLKKSGYSEDYIRAQFKKVTGKTPTEFLTETRISHACYLIGTYKNSVPLNVISEKCGYTDYIYFSRRFKQIMGTSPRKYMEDSTSF